MRYKIYFLPAMLCILGGLFMSAKPGHTNLNKNPASSHKTIPLQSVELLFATPAWGDGKNDDNSMVDAEIKIYSTDGNTYTGFGHFRDPSGIPKNSERSMPIEMSGGINQLEKSTITKISIKITYWIEAGIFHSDHWNMRRELIMHFPDNTILCSGYNEPAYEIDFGNTRQDIDPKISEILYNHKTLVAPY